MQQVFYIWHMNNAQTTATINNVIRLPRRYSWEYLYEVNGCIFSIEKGCNGVWYLTGYDSHQQMEQGNFFISEPMDLKRQGMHFLKYTFKRELWKA